MFKIFRNVGLILLILSSFIYTEKLTSVVKEYDDIMIKIKESSNNYKINPIESVIKDNTIIEKSHLLFNEKEEIKNKLNIKSKENFLWLNK